MERPFDPTLKTLAELAPTDWLVLANRRRRRVTVQDSDVSTVVSGATDKLFRVNDEPEYFLHLDFEAGHFRSDLPLRLRLYNSLFEYRQFLLNNCCEGVREHWHWRRSATSGPATSGA